MNSKLKFHLKLFWVSFLILTIIILNSFVFQVNAVAFETKLIQDYENKLEAARQENETLTVESARINSLDSHLIKPFGFEKTGKIHYIKVLEEMVVITQ